MRSNFTPEVVLWLFLRMRTKSEQNGSKPGQNSGHVRNRARGTKVCTTLMPEGKLWPFLRMRNSKLGKNSRSERGETLPKLNIEKKTSHVKLC